MIDFTNCEVNKYKYYGGRNGGKICIIYNDEEYMLKFPPINQGITEHSYSNSCISEYLACHIISTLGLNVQDTLLGEYSIQGEKKIVVACKDFTNTSKVLKQFAELKNSQIITSKNGYGTELSEILQTIEEQQIYDVKELTEFFWNLFIVDTLVGNFDRHNGNWGFLIDEKIAEILNNETELEARVYTFPTSSIKENDVKLNYYRYISSLKNEDCNQALVRVFPLIDLAKINQIIDATPSISTIRKEFYKKIIEQRYYKILKYSFDLLREKC